MVEYAALASKNFGETFLNVWQDASNFFSGIPFYWYIIAVAALIIITRALAGK